MAETEQNLYYAENTIEKLMKEKQELIRLLKEANAEKDKAMTLNYIHEKQLLLKQKKIADIKAEMITKVNDEIETLKRGYEAMKGMTYRSLKYQGELMENRNKLKIVMKVFIRTSTPYFKVPQRTAPYKGCELGMDIPSMKGWFALVLEYNELMDIKWDDIKEEHVCFKIPNIIHLTDENGVERLARNPEQNSVVRMRYKTIKMMCDEKVPIGHTNAYEGTKLEQTREGDTRICYNMGD